MYGANACSGSVVAWVPRRLRIPSAHAQLKGPDIDHRHGKDWDPTVRPNISAGLTGSKQSSLIRLPDCTAY